MKKVILIYGIIGGVIVSAMMWLTLGLGGHNFENGMFIGFTTMVIAMSCFFFGIRAYREKHLDGRISFGKALLMGLGMSLVTSTMYVASWLVMEANSDKDFMTEYITYEKARLEKANTPPAEVEAKLKEWREFAED